MARERSLVARRIEEVRTSKNLSREALGKLLGISRVQVWRYETGESDVPSGLIPDIAEALGVSAGYLVREAKAS